MNFPIENNRGNKISYKHCTVSLYIQVDNQDCMFHQCNRKLNCSNNVLNTLFHICFHNIWMGSLGINVNGN